MKRHLVTTALAVCSVGVTLVPCIGSRPWPRPIPPRPIPAFVCESLDSLPVGLTVVNGLPPVNSFQPPLMDIAAHPFAWASGVTTTAGQATTEAGGRAGGSGTEIRVNNIVLSVSIGFGQVMHAARIRFGEYGGNVNLSVDGVTANVADLASLNGKTMGGVTVSVPTGGFGNDMGVLELTGTMPDQAFGLGQFAIGGQELWIDDICYQP
ncbi:hypothetical protein Cch01nite_09220 [Cellulomonas chitinilytica]|uniref:Uncharacterized protein n=1 Tax=Cellulomonas chitinilytica TaxID=398759 RepID=A0A919TYX1_9CELL|nr:hypothetical protein [Cellulomonas chitinilytica]GIG20198.1 hypothetical protein Cch01nite_09220 [Cellulomonas chitinilytica]